MTRLAVQLSDYLGGAASRVLSRDELNAFRIEALCRQGCVKDAEEWYFGNVECASTRFARDWLC